MPVTDTQYAQLVVRVSNLERSMNDVFVAMRNLISISQVNELLVLTQTELTDLRESVDSLVDRVTLIENDPEL